MPPREVKMLQKVPRWMLIAGGVLVPAVALAASALPTDACGGWCSLLFGCGG